MAVTFGFTIGDFEYGEGGPFHVSLPHQCSEWTIAPDDEASAIHYSGYEPTKAESVEWLRLFIAEAQECLATLEAM